MKKYWFISVILVVLIMIGSASAEIVDDKTVQSMTEFNTWMSKIAAMPAVIDNDICEQNWEAYKQDMNKLANYIIQANTLIKDVQLYYPIDLWYVYNQISANPVCGLVRAAGDSFDVAQTSSISNQEKMGILESDDVCMCWNIATGRDEPTGFYKDGACRCTYGTKAYSPNIGRNDVPWFTDTTQK